MNYTEQQAEWITQQILQELATSKKTAAPAAAPVALNIPVGVSNRHVHLCREDMDILFGYGSTLTRSKALKQPGQYAAEEMVTLRGPKGELNKVRVLGPLRNATQVEISVADGFALGTKAPVRMSGDLLDSPGIEIIGPKGRVVKHNGRSSSREQEIAEISRTLKGIARELNVPVIALSQLNRAAETREDKKPIMADLRESGSIEQDADVVMLMSRFYDKETKTEDRNRIIVNVAKQRNGPVGEVELVWLPQYTKFENAETEQV